MKRPSGKRLKGNDADVCLRLGLAIRMRRVMLGLSQERAAEGLGVTFQQLQKYENASNRVSVPALVRLADILKCTPAELLEDATRTTAEAVLSSSIPRATIEIMRALERLDHGKRAAVLRIVKKMAR